MFWLIFFGWWLCLTHKSTGIVQCISIIGIPVEMTNFEITAIALWLVGRRVVSVEEARLSSLLRSPHNVESLARLAQLPV